jgi:hypothetical protein
LETLRDEFVPEIKHHTPDVPWILVGLRVTLEMELKTKSPNSRLRTSQNNTELQNIKIAQLSTTLDWKIYLKEPQS